MKVGIATFDCHNFSTNAIVVNSLELLKRNEKKRKKKGKGRNNVKTDGETNS